MLRFRPSCLPTMLSFPLASSSSSSFLSYLAAREVEDHDPSLSDPFHCEDEPPSDTHFPLRVAAIFVIGIGSMLGSLFPVLAKQSRLVHVPRSVFNFAKYFGSGVILATGFIHLLGPAIDALGSQCLPWAWRDYPYALALCMFSIFSIFLVELVAFRWGNARLAKLHVAYDAHGHEAGAHAAHGPESAVDDPEKSTGDSAPTKQSEGELEYHWTRDDQGITQAIGLAILEFGVVLHSILVGLTLAVNEDFIVLFIVLVFHQTFEGLGLGSRLAEVELPPRFRHLPVFGAIIFGFTTPLGIAVGLGVRSSFNPGSTTAAIVSGVMDSFSAGVLIYTGLVELLAHDFLFNKKMMAAPTRQLVFAIGSMMLGVALMALLGRWA
ncbi:Zinc/iron permease [Flagelloscypha sp. PMI_526]|nr:Zinc/iron permease [Flagelloscypha sp. PMI_526]